jgi:NADH-quinone oxidoreductase subunit N
LLISREFLKDRKLVRFEFDLIICFSVIGLICINGSTDFLTLYIAIELQSLCFYLLAAFARNSEHSVEAGVKYSILGALGSSVLLFGLSFFYGCFGSLDFEQLQRINIVSYNLMALYGYVAISIALLFKLGAFPFHSWLCDVYEGSCVTITAFFSVVPKSILLALFMRIVLVVFSNFDLSTNVFFFSAGLGSIIFASTTALYQKRIKRLIGYSTISHTGFMLTCIYCMSIESIKTCTIYIIFYISLMLLFFGALFFFASNNPNQKYLVS